MSLGHPAASAMLDEVARSLPKVLAGRQLAFIGDSVSQYLFDDLSDRLTATLHTKPTVVPFVGFINATYHQHCHQWKSPPPIFQLCFASAARKDPASTRPAGSLRVQRTSNGDLLPGACDKVVDSFEEYSIGDSMECLLARGSLAKESVAIVNFGLHHNEESSLRDQANGFVQWLSSARRAAAASNGPSLPCLLWMQSLPQHFPTPDGTYRRNWLFDEKCNTNSANSSALTLATIGDGSGCAPLPRGLPSGSQQRFNDMTDGIIADVGLPAIGAWRLAAEHWDEHSGCICYPTAWINRSATAVSKTHCGQMWFKRHVLDCTHFQRPQRRMRVHVTFAHAKVLRATLEAVRQHCPSPAAQGAEPPQDAVKLI